MADYWESLPVGRDVRLIARDENGVAAFAKPAGVLSHPNAPSDAPRSLLACSYDDAQECFAWRGAGGAENHLWLLNRLDSATSGVILAASEVEIARAIKQQFKRRQVRKVYQALVFGAPSFQAQVWRDRLAVERRGGAIRAATTGNIPAEAACRVLRRRPGQPPLALIQLEPKTGRSHQLRVQCARRGLPIVGDQTYGDFRLNRDFARATGSKRLFLHSLTTRFDYVVDGKTFGFAATAPLPPEFADALR
jgi:23S rRNA-/tRNA-specific pseudouridylate synthase